MARLIFLGDDPNPRREIAIALTIAADWRARAATFCFNDPQRTHALDVAYGWMGEARRLRLTREQDQRMAA